MMKPFPIVVRVLIACLCFVGALTQKSQAQNSTNWSLNGSVDDFAVFPGWGGLGVGEDLTGYSTKYSGSLIAMNELPGGGWNLKSGLPLFTGGDVPVRVIIKSLDIEGYIVGGDFTAVDGLPYKYLVRLKRNESGAFVVDTNFDPKVNGTVNALYLASSRTGINSGRPVVYVGGAFTRSGTTDRLNLTAIDEFSGATVPGGRQM